MKNILKKLSLSLALLSGLSLFGQTVLTNTTLSVAVADSSTTTVVLTSATGVNAPSASDYTKSTYIYVDRELMDVRSVNGTILGVVRGAEGTAAAPHAASAFTFVIPAYLATYIGGGGYGMAPGVPSGSCTRANELILPRIQFTSGIVSDCDGGQWVNGDALQTTRPTNGTLGLRLPDPGATALTALETAGTAAGAATEEYCIELDIPYSFAATGLGILNGTTVGTDKHMVVLRDAGGKVLRTSAVAGTTTSGASTYQKHDFTAKYFLAGPARYFGCFQANGTTDTVRHTITAVNNNVFAGKLTGQTFGTAVDATMPSTFTTALGPYLLIY